MSCLIRRGVRNRGSVVDLNDRTGRGGVRVVASLPSARGAAIAAQAYLRIAGFAGGAYEVVRYGSDLVSAANAGFVDPWAARSDVARLVGHALDAHVVGVRGSARNGRRNRVRGIVPGFGGREEERGGSKHGYERERGTGDEGFSCFHNDAGKRNMRTYHYLDINIMICQ